MKERAIDITYFSGMAIIMGLFVLSGICIVYAIDIGYNTFIKKK